MLSVFGAGVGAGAAAFTTGVGSASGNGCGMGAFSARASGRIITTGRSLRAMATGALAMASATAAA